LEKVNRVLLIPIIAAVWVAAVWVAAAETPQLPADYAERLAALERTRLTQPNDMQVLEALAGSYAMAAEYRKAIAVLQHMRTLNPADGAIGLRLARNYTWAGDSGRAIVEYTTYLRAARSDRQATIELIRLRRYRGDYSQAEKLCNRLLSTDPDDAEVLALKAEVLHWVGNRRLLARRTADQAAALAPASPDAKVSQVYAALDLGERRRASREFASLRDLVDRRGGITADSSYGDAYKLLEGTFSQPNDFSIKPGYSIYNDSDGIHDTFRGWRMERRIAADHRIVLDLAQYTSSAPGGSIFTDGRDHADLYNVRAGGQVRLAPAVLLTLLGGGSYRRTDNRMRPVFNVQITASPIDRWTFDLSAGREFLGVTPRAIDRGTAYTSVAGTIQFAVDSRTSLAVRADRRYWSDANQSIAGEATLRTTLHAHRHLSVDAGLLSHEERFHRDTRFEAGFFTPDRYRRHDGFLVLRGELGRVRYDVQGSGGAQQIARTADYRPDWDFASTVSVGLGRSLQLSASYQRRNYSLTSKDGWYQGLQFTLGIER
jgi:Flp pilus assembly protein TadD